MSTETIELAIASIRQDGGTQPRNQKDATTIADYHAAMAQGATFPAVEVFYDGTTYWLVDGFHRLTAAVQSGWTTFPAQIRQGTQADAQWYSFGVNATHGLHRSAADKRRAVESALRHPYAVTKSNRELARHCQVDEKTVRTIRATLEATADIPQSPSRTGADGRTINTQHIGQRAPTPPSVATESHEDLAQVTPDGTTTVTAPVVAPPAARPATPVALTPLPPADEAPVVLTPLATPTTDNPQHLQAQQALVQAMLVELTARLAIAQIDLPRPDDFPSAAVGQAARQALTSPAIQAAAAMLALYLPQEVTP
ncbi:MAG: ParB N-terminal domain-containing protein [Blastochloris sp.]|nr:ParB N-terminal domain-containing protein [Blastochloris sp.]